MLAVSRQVAALAIALCLTTTALPAAEIQFRAPLPIPVSGTGAAEESRGDLTLAIDERKQIGEYKINDSMILFSGEEQSDGRVVLEVRANGLVFDGEYDPNDEDGPVFYFDGHDASLVAADKLALQALSLRLEKEWDGPGSEPLAVQRQWILRMVMLVAEAPVGFVLERREIRAPTSTVAPPGRQRERQSPGRASVLAPEGSGIERPERPPSGSLTRHGHAIQSSSAAEYG